MKKLSGGFKFISSQFAQSESHFHFHFHFLVDPHRPEISVHSLQNH